MDSELNLKFFQKLENFISHTIELVGQSAATLFQQCGIGVSPVSYSLLKLGDRPAYVKKLRRDRRDAYPTFFIQRCRQGCRRSVLKFLSGFYRKSSPVILFFPKDQVMSATYEIK
jgi:hypothetical protein